MSESAPEERDSDVVVVTSRPGSAGERSFRLETDEEEAEAPRLPEDLRHEAALVEHMKGRGYRLTMVGGGSRGDDVRRFYFRPEGSRGKG